MPPPNANASPAVSDTSGGRPPGPPGPPRAPRPPRPIPLRPLGSAPNGAAARRLPRWIGTFAGCVLGGVLLVAAWAKALDPAAFAQQVHADGLDRLLPASILALAALGLEAGLGLALLLGVRRLWVMLPATLLAAFFILLNGRAYWLAAHGRISDAAACGCFGNLVQRTPAEAFWQDALLLALPLALAFLGRGRKLPMLPPLRTAAIAAFTLGVPLFAWRAPELPLDDLATRLKPGAAVAKLCAGRAGSRDAVCLDTVAPELDRGNHLVVLDDLDDPALAKAVASLNAYADAPGAAAVWVLTASDEKRQRLFFWKWGPTFKIAGAPAELLRPLYRRLPRSFAVQDGRVTATFSGLPPLPKTAGAPQPGPLAPASPVIQTAPAPNGATSGNPSARPNR